MATLAIATSLHELKSLYRRFAAMHHPDKGGCHIRMQKLNKQYTIMKCRLKNAVNDSVMDDDFSGVEVGCRLYINQTPAEVLHVDENSFRAVALGRSRQAVFDKNTGYGKYNSRLKACFSPRHR